MSILPASTDRGFTVKAELTPDPVNSPVPASGPPKRSRRRGGVENDDYIAFCRRAIRAAGRRVAAGDVEALPELLTLVGDLDRAIAVAVKGLREFGYSWAEIASRVGTSKQAAQQRWGGDTE